MTRWFLRRKRKQVVAEAQIDYRDGLLEARAERIAELVKECDGLLGENAQLKAALAAAVLTARSVDWMPRSAAVPARRVEQSSIRPSKHGRPS